MYIMALSLIIIGVWFDLSFFCYGLSLYLWKLELFLVMIVFHAHNSLNNLLIKPTFIV
jgi:hypothetical protein